MKNLVLDGSSLTIREVYQAAMNPSSLAFDASAKRKMHQSRQLVEQWIRTNKVVYGVTTGFGEFSNVNIASEDIEQLQKNLVMSHSAGVGDPLPYEVVRAMIILRLNALAKGYSGIRLETMEFIRKVFNARIVPIIPSKGSVGSSGDLAQLAHLVLTLMGKGKVWYNEMVMNSNLALSRIGLRPLKLSAKEGLSLINGTQMMAAYGVLAVYEALELCKMADIVAAMSVEALKGSDTAFDNRIQSVRQYRGQRESAANLRKLMQQSEIRESHRHNDPRVQDPYSIRCIPQVHGASRDAVRYVYDVLTIEINSATDNPLIFPKDKVHLEGGNFHGQPVALALDFLAIALAELANISERRIERMVNGTLSGLPRFLTLNGGLNSGMMIAQYTAASLVSENKVLAHPASVDSIPTSANQEDHNSMGSISAQKVWQVLHNVQTVIAIELMVAAQGIDFSCVHPARTSPTAARPNGLVEPARLSRSGGRVWRAALSGEPKTKKIMKAGKGVQSAHQSIRKYLKHLDNDRVLSEDIQTARRLLREGIVLKAVEKSIGTLQ